MWSQTACAYALAKALSVAALAPPLATTPGMAASPPDDHAAVSNAAPGAASLASSI
jgi:hypothetical protein